MRFTATTDALTEGLSWATQSLPSRPAQPILAGIKIVVADGTVRLNAFDYEQSTLAEVQPESITADGAAVVSGRLLNEIVKALPTGVVTVFLDGTKVRLEAGTSSRYSLPTMPVEEYPSLPSLPAAAGVVEGRALAVAAHRVTPAAGRDDSVPLLTAVCVETDPEIATMSVVATDRYRVAVSHIDYTPSGDDDEGSQVLVPWASFAKYAKALAGAEEVTFGSGGETASLFSVATPTLSATTRLLEGNYPKWQALFPSEFHAVATVPVARMVEVVKRVQLVADKVAPCRLTFSDGSVRVWVGGGDDASGSEDVDDVTYEGEPLTMAFNFRYLLDGLSGVGTQQATIHLVEPRKPAVIKSVIADAEPDYWYLIMPVRIKD